MKRVFIHTFGCQMNVNDTLRMSEALAALHYAPTATPEQADLIILNTCSIREKAEEKVLSALGRYRQVKLQRGALIGVGGCVAQQEKDRLLKKVPYVDFVFGPDAIGKLPDIIGRLQGDREQRVRVVETAWVDSESYVFPAAAAETTTSAASASCHTRAGVK
jgi:tRNA-2-methylthio-N6-dimethylallyladenosine synthase